MLTITVPDQEFYDGKKETFFTVKGGVLELEHSLKAISLWESKWKKPFLTKDNKTVQESIYYIKCMATNKVDDSIFTILQSESLKKIQEYLEDSQTATTIYNFAPKRNTREVITSELIYFWMFSQQVPIDCENWNINRLFMLLEICSIKNSPKQKMKNKDIINQYRSLNASRKKSLGTSG